MRHKYENGCVFIFVLGACERRDMTSESTIYPALLETSIDPRYPGYCATVSLTELTGGQGSGIQLTGRTEGTGTFTVVLQNSHYFRVRYRRLTELTEVPGRYTNAAPVPGHCGTRVQSVYKFRVGICIWYKAHRSSGCGYGSPTEHIKVLVLR